MKEFFFTIFCLKSDIKCCKEFSQTSIRHRFYAGFLHPTRESLQPHVYVLPTIHVWLVNFTRYITDINAMFWVLYPVFLYIVVR